MFELEVKSKCLTQIVWANLKRTLVVELIYQFGIKIIIAWLAILPD